MGPQRVVQLQASDSQSPACLYRAAQQKGYRGSCERGTCTSAMVAHPRRRGVEHLRQWDKAEMSLRLSISDSGPASHGNPQDEPGLRDAPDLGSALPEDQDCHAAEAGERASIRARRLPRRLCRPRAVCKILLAAIATAPRLA